MSSATCWAAFLFPSFNNLYRYIFLSALVYGLLLAGLITLGSPLVALAIPVLLFLLYGFWNAPGELALGVQRSLSNDRATADSEVVVTLTVTNRGADIEELYLEDKASPRMTIRSGSPRHLVRLAKGASFTFTYTVAGPRGIHVFKQVDALAAGPLGLIRRRQTLVTDETITVFPVVTRLKSVSIHPRRTRVYAGMIPGRAGGSGTEFFGVREYQSGDSPRMINWRASARHLESLYSNEYQLERVADVGVVLDAREKANVFHSGNSLFEYAVMAAAALSDVFLAHGNRVGLLVYGTYLGWTLPGYGKIQRERIMRALAGAEAGASSVFTGLHHLSPHMFPPESQIVLVSSLVNDDLEVLIQLRGRGYQAMVISPDPIEFERRHLPESPNVELAARIIRMERRLLIRRLERAGIHVVEWDVSIPLDQAIGPVLMRAHRFAYGRLPS
jgi:uncharacterized protein (DUF58 family)